MKILVNVSLLINLRRLHNKIKCKFQSNANTVLHTRAYTLRRNIDSRNITTTKNKQ